jgi:hypothetical protein
MTSESFFEKIQKFLETKPASKKLMSHLSSSVEIGVFAGKTLECTYFKQGDQPKFEMRKARSPDVVFHFTPEALETLLKSEANDLSDLVSDVAKLYLAGTVKINLPGSIPRFLVRGYVQALKASHVKVLELLKDPRLESLKILSLLQKLKSQK